MATSYFTIGVMSGTSLDGIDLAYAKFTKDGQWQYEIVVAETLQYEAAWQERLKNGIALPTEALQELDQEYTSYLAEVIKQFIKKNQISELDAVCSHGHTILHDPAAGVTYQIGNRPELATLVGQRVICDFRVKDVKLGGQGAPLVPIGDRLLFGNYDFCLNLGGFANISFEKNDHRIAFDICPVNIVLNAQAVKLGLPYDAEGKIAATRAVDVQLLEKLEALPFYEKLPPKSLGLEWVKNEVDPLLEAETLSPETIISTFTEHAAIQVAKVLRDQSGISQKHLLITGGGAYNKHLLGRILKLSKVAVIVPDEDLIEFKEALIFAFMGVLRLRNQVNVLKSVTGAAQDHCSGTILNP
ncbi:MAG: anhydro-N-acetylmuramic acid kinase [Leeuwenhoekiella sp.]